MEFGPITLKSLDAKQRTKGALLSSWFFLTVATLWLLKPVRVASLLAHLGAVETPYVRLAGVVTVALVVMLYSAIVDRLSRVAVVRWANAIFGVILLLFWVAIRLGGAWLGAQRPFVWAVYILVEVYSVVIIGVFWTYTNDVCSEDDSNKLYGVIGLGGIVGGAAGGAFVDAFARPIGPANLLLICAALAGLAAALGSLTEAAIRPPPRAISRKDQDRSFADALAGAREVRASSYLLLIVGIVVAYEFTATLTDFGISVVFERSFRGETELAKMYGRLGWIVSTTALVSQLVLVPLLLPKKRAALLVPPLVMVAGAVVLLAAPVAAAAMVLGASDRGLNYSLHQATKESLYVPLTDAQKYKAKAFIDMLIDRAAKALAAFALIAIILVSGPSVSVSLGTSFVSMGLWVFAAHRLGTYWDQRSGRFVTSPLLPPRSTRRARSSHGSTARALPVTPANDDDEGVARPSASDRRERRSG